MASTVIIEVSAEMENICRCFRLHPYQLGVVHYYTVLVIVIQQ